MQGYPSLPHKWPSSSLLSPHGGTSTLSSDPRRPAPDALSSKCEPCSAANDLGEAAVSRQAIELTPNLLELPAALAHSVLVVFFAIVTLVRPHAHRIVSNCLDATRLLSQASKKGVDCLLRHAHTKREGSAHAEPTKALKNHVGADKPCPLRRSVVWIRMPTPRDQACRRRPGKPLPGEPPALGDASHVIDAAHSARLTQTCIPTSPYPPTA